MSKIIKTKETVGLVDGYLAEAQEGSVTIPSLVSSSSAAEWVTFQEKYGVGGSLIGAFNSAWNGKYAVEVVTLDTYAILETGFNTTYMFVNPVAGGDVLVSLPAAADIGEGAVIDVVVVGTFTGETHDGMFVLSVDGDDTIAWNPGGTYTSVNISTQQTFSKVTLMSNGTNGWGVLDGMGYWGEAALAEGVWTLTAGYRFDGRLPSGVEDNAVSIDAFGNIKDSGVPVSSGGGAFLTDVIMPVSSGDDPTTMDRGDEWFNVSYSSSAVSGFEITAVVPDAGPDPMPLRYTVSVAGGDCILRSGINPDDPLTVYEVPGKDVDVIGPLCFIYVKYDGEVGPFIQTESYGSWDRDSDREYALLHVLSIYELAMPGATILETILIDDEYPSTEPEFIDASSGNPIQLFATGVFVDASTADISDQVTWESTDEALATVTSTGIVHAENPGAGGTVYVNATIGNIVGMILIDVGSF
jgi:hypothetical protein